MTASTTASAVRVEAERFSRAEWWGLASASVLLLLFTLPFIGKQGLWLDEIFSLETARNWPVMFDVFARYENNMALYYLMLWLWMFLGDGEFTVRLLSVVFALATLPVVHLLARSLFSARAAIIADLLLISSKFFEHYAGEARSYSLLTLLSASSSLLFLRALQRPGWGAWLTYAVVAASAVYAHYFALLIVVAHGVALVVRGHPPIPWPQLRVALVVMLIALSPLAIFRPESLHQTDFLQAPTFFDVYAFALLFGSGRGQLLVGGICLVALVISHWRRRGEPDEDSPGGSVHGSGSWGIWFLVAWLLVPLIIALAFSVMIKPLFLPKYLIGCLPAYILLMAAGAARLRTAAAGVAVAAMLAPFMIDLFRHSHSGGEWREAATYLAAHAKPGDVVIGYPFLTLRPINHYLERLPDGPRRLQLQSISSQPFHPGGGARDPDPDMALVERLAHDHGRVWIVAGSMLTEDLNRHWLPRIVTQVRQTLPQQDSIEFLSDTNVVGLRLLSFSPGVVPVP